MAHRFAQIVTLGGHGTVRTKYGGKVFVFSHEDEVKLVVEIDGEESVIHMTCSQVDELLTSLYTHSNKISDWRQDDADDAD